MPNSVYREATEDHVFPGGGRIEKGSRIVASLVPSTADPKEDEDLLFGAGLHKCKGKDMALGVLRGLIACVLDEERLRPGSSSHELLYDEVSGELQK